MAQEPTVEVQHITPHGVAAKFPTTLADLQRYDVVIFSDVGYNSMIFYSGLTPPYIYPLGPDRVGMVRTFVEKGGGFLMVGVYLSFAGLNGIAHWGGTEVEAILPVAIAPYDDRVEVTQGFRFELVQPNHPIVVGLPWSESSWTLCGYNRVKLKDGATLVASYQNDPTTTPVYWDDTAGHTTAGVMTINSNTTITFNDDGTIDVSYNGDVIHANVYESTLDDYCEFAAI